MGFLLTLPLLLAAPMLGAPTQEVELYEPTGGVEPIAETTIGMRVLLEELVIPGAALRPIDVADPGRAEVILRVINVFSHGSDHRYNLEVTPFVEGDIDLRDHMERVDGSSMEGVPELIVLVDAVLEPTVMQPNDIDVPHPAGVGGYRTMLIAAGVLWFLGLLALIFVGHKKSEAALSAAAERPKSLADRLRPLVEGARSGELSNEGRAELERLLLAHWRKERNLEGERVADAVTKLRSDEEAGPLFRQLEEWLHRPAGASDTSIDVAGLLAPYENVPGQTPETTSAA